MCRGDCFDRYCCVFVEVYGSCLWSTRPGEGDGDSFGRWVAMSCRFVRLMGIVCVALVLYLFVFNTGKRRGVERGRVGLGGSDSEVLFSGMYVPFGGASLLLPGPGTGSMRATVSGAGFGTSEPFCVPLCCVGPAPVFCKSCDADKRVFSRFCNDNSRAALLKVKQVGRTSVVFRRRFGGSFRAQLNVGTAGCGFPGDAKRTFNVCNTVVCRPGRELELGIFKMCAPACRCNFCEGACNVATKCSFASQLRVRINVRGCCGPRGN